MSVVATSKYLAFTLGGELFAVDITSAREILDFCEITRIPHMPSFIRGVVNLRGNAVTVVDLKQQFGMGRTERTILTRIIILELPQDKHPLLIGVLADSVKEVLELEESQIEPPPLMGAQVRSDFLKGVARHKGGFLLLLDEHKVFAPEELERVRLAAPPAPR
ncbi:chemotaxis protein CheW [Megalodesulfovibrio gigas]|uniref:Putative CheW protein n=1 Tax=Megalodesulfovibrio gigas (strain ATCC 19364 / DSM 1382 / NCIMB 9332 / VKM B-1759) TaxID=1121448 RepID=T2G7P9_MEGG1|nr:chemotaxis protein CheW [Megalodesulfovibrio gigas]AGW12318.1 putative CheW protein [Megalodesulfovibrio gigas DSM 1382 = ATCC 19364]